MALTRSFFHSFLPSYYMHERLTILHIVHETFDRVSTALKLHQIAQRRGIGSLLPPNIPEVKAPIDDINAELLPLSELPFYSCAAALRESLEMSGVDVEMLLSNPSLNLDMGSSLSGARPQLVPAGATSALSTSLGSVPSASFPQHSSGVGFLEATMMNLGTSFFRFDATCAADSDCYDSMLFLAAPAEGSLERERIEHISRDLFTYVVSRALYRCRNVLPNGQVTLQSCRKLALDTFNAMDQQPDDTVTWDTFVEFVLEEATLQHRMSSPGSGSGGVGSSSEVTRQLIGISWPVVPEHSVRMVPVQNSQLVLFDRLVHVSSLPFDNAPKLSSASFGTAIEIRSDIDFSLRHRVARSSVNDIRTVVDAAWITNLPAIPPMIVVCGSDMYLHAFEVNHMAAQSQLKRVCKVRCDSTVTCMKLLPQGRLVLGDREGCCALLNVASLLRPVSKDAASTVQISGAGSNVVNVKLPVLHRHTAPPPEEPSARLVVEPSVDAADAIMGVCAPHTQPLTAVIVLSPTTVMTSSLDGQIAFIDAHSWGVVRRFRAEASGVTGMCYSPSFGTLVTSTFDSVVKVWPSLGTGGEPLSLRDTANPHTRRIILTHLFSDAHELLTVDGNGVAKTWDLTTGACLQSKPLLSGETVEGHCHVARSAQYHPRYKRLTILTKGEHAVVAQYVPGTAFLRAHEDSVGSIVAPAGCSSWLSVSHLDHKVWDVATGSLKATFKEEDVASTTTAGGGPPQISYSLLDSKGSRILYATYDGHIHERRVASGRVVRVYSLFSPSFDKVTPSEEALHVVLLFECEGTGEFGAVCAGGTIRTFSPSATYTHPTKVASLFSEAELLAFEQSHSKPRPSNFRRQSVVAARVVMENQRRDSSEFNEEGLIHDPVVFAVHSTASQMVCCVTLSGLIRAVRTTSSSGAATHEFRVPAEITGVGVLDPYPVLVVGDADGFLTLFLLQPAPLMAAIQRDLAVSPPKPRSNTKTPSLPQTLKERHVGFNVALPRDSVNETRETVASRQWALRFQNDSGVPSAFGFDSHNGRLYVTDQGGAIVVYDTSRFLCALHLVPITKNLSDAFVLYRMVERESRSLSLRLRTMDESLLRLAYGSSKLQRQTKGGRGITFIGDDFSRAESSRFSTTELHRSSSFLQQPGLGEASRNLLNELAEAASKCSPPRGAYSPVDGVTSKAFVKRHFIGVVRSVSTHRTQASPSPFFIFGKFVAGTPAAAKDEIDEDIGSVTALSVLPSGFVLLGSQGGIVRLWAPDLEYPLSAINKGLPFNDGLKEAASRYRSLVREQRGVELDTIRNKMLKGAVETLFGKVSTARPVAAAGMRRVVEEDTLAKIIDCGSSSSGSESEPPAFLVGDPFAGSTISHNSEGSGEPMMINYAVDQDVGASDEEDDDESTTFLTLVPTPPATNLLSSGRKARTVAATNGHSPRKTWSLYAGASPLPISPSSQPSPSRPPPPKRRTEEVSTLPLYRVGASAPQSRTAGSSSRRLIYGFEI